MSSVHAAILFLGFHALFMVTATADGGPSHPASLRVELEDYAGLTPALRRELAGRNRAILSGAGLSATVVVCGPEEVSRCLATEQHSRQVFVRLVTESRRKRPHNVFRTLGVAIADGKGGSYAEVFVVPVKDEAAEASLPWIILLAYAVSHEEGHLLLGDQAHAAAGLMKPHWDVRDYVAMSHDSLVFSPTQKERLQKACEDPPQVAQDHLP